MNRNRSAASGLRRWSVPALLAGLWLSGCAAVPEALRPLPEPMPTIAAVQGASGEELIGAPVVWGGVIANRRNVAEGSFLEIVARPLDRQQRPLEVDLSDGRFRVHTPEFLEPQTFQEGREVTVRGIVSGRIRDRVDEYPYLFPEVEAEVIHLWPPRPEVIPIDRRDWFWDPWRTEFGYPWPIAPPMMEQPP